MNDFNKANLIDINRDTLKSNKRLVFKSMFESRSGEITPCRIDKDKDGKEIPIYKETAIYNGIKFIDFSNGVTQIEFTPHKYFNICNGFGNQNYNDFGVNEIEWVVNDLKRKFNISPSNINLRLIEIGVNLTDIGFSITEILNSCLMHKKKPFILKKDDKHGHYIWVEYDDYEVKIYDKGKQFRKLGFKIGEILRIEIKFTKLRKLKTKGIYTMQDLLDYGFENFKKELITEWKNILYYDSTLNSTDKRLLKYNNITFWKNLTSKGNENKYKHHKKELGFLTKKHSENWQHKIGDLIIEKINSLVKITPILHQVKKEELIIENPQFTPLFNLLLKKASPPNIHYSNSGCKLDVDEVKNQPKKEADLINEKLIKTNGVRKPFLSFQKQKKAIEEYNRLAVQNYNAKYNL